MLAPLTNVLSVLPLPFHIMMAYTGLVLIYYAYIPAGVAMLYAGDSKVYQRAASMSAYTDVQTPPGRSHETTDLWPLVAKAAQAWGGGPAINIYISHPNRENAAVEIWRQRDDRISNFPDRVAFDGVTGSTSRVLNKRSAMRETQSFLAGLHFIEWGGIWARWLYFIVGLMSAGMVATALVLFVTKRENKRSQPSQFFAMARRINIAVVAGNVNASAAYLYAERIVPPDALDRRASLASIYFLAWLLCLMHAAVRPSAKGWAEQLAVGGLACCLLPASSARVGTGLAQTIARGDWVRAGTDLTMLTVGFCLAVGAAQVKQRTHRAIR